MQVLGYKCKVTEGSEGYYADFSIGIQGHRETVHEIHKKLDVSHVFYRMDWLKYLKAGGFDLSVIRYEECVFPEFRYVEDLMRFISYLNSVSEKYPKNFINLSIFL